MGIAILWEAGNRLHRFDINRGETVFIGRPGRKHLSIYKDLSPIGVYIIPEDIKVKPLYTGYDSLLVSRMDTRIKVPETQNYIEITNHGANGSGATNPTIVNGEKLKPGETIRIPIKTGESIQVKLSSLGPIFTIAPEQGKTPVIEIRAGKPVLLPATIANAIEARGFVEESSNLGENKAIIVKGLYGDKIIVKIDNERIMESLEGINVVVQEIKEKLTKQEKETEELLSLKQVLQDMYIMIDEASEHPSMQGEIYSLVYSQLQMSYYGRLFNKLGGQASIAYSELITLLRHSVTSPDRIKKIIKILINLVDIKARNQRRK